MIPRWRPWVVLLLVVVAKAEESPGLVSKDTTQDLVAEASQNGAQTQKRDAALSNSYGEPLPADVYGPPLNIPNIAPELPLPVPVYGVPDSTVFGTPPGAYGPPAPVVFPNQNYEGPPPPIGKPKPTYGPPKFHKQTYGPPKPIYGPPKKSYGPPKQSLPKPTYGIPFKPPKVSFPKPFYGAPKPIYGAPKPIYGPPKVTYGAPSLSIQNIPLDLPVSLPHNFGNIGTSVGNIGPSIGNIGSVSSIGTNFGSLETSVGTSIGTNIDLGLNLPAPIYGTPITSLPGNLKPKFPVPSDTYGPPGYPLGPVGPNDQLVVHDFGSIGHYGPPQPDPNPRPPHPGIPAPPTPPHVLYDGWKPIPGVSKSVIESVGHIETFDQYGPPPPIPPVVQEININLDGHSLPNLEQPPQFAGAQIATGYSNVHQDALANIDLNAIVGGDSNHIDESKTVFEAHYTENHSPQADLAFIQTLHEKPLDSYGAPPIESLSNGPYPPSHRQQGAKGLIPPSGIYGVPPGSQYGAPPKPLPANLPIPYGSFSGGGHSIHTGGHTPRHPIKFRDSVPEGLIQQIGHTSHHKDTHGVDHIKQGPAYLPPPIRDIKDNNQNSGSLAINDISLSIEPSNLYSLPHSGQSIKFQQLQQPSSSYGSPIDSYSVPLLTVSDHTASGSTSNAVAATVDGMILANLSNLEAAAILKHCPYHEAILKAAKLGEKIPSELASSYVASLSSLGSTFQKHQQQSSQNTFNIPITSGESLTYNTKDLSTASHNLVHTIVPNNLEDEKTIKISAQKGKSMKDAKDRYKQNPLQFVSDQIYETSEKIKNLSEETKQLQQKIVSSSQNLNKVHGQVVQFDHPEIPIKGDQALYSVQIQSSDDGRGKGDSPSIPHDQLLSEGLLQSILQAIEQPGQSQVKNHIDKNIYQSQIKTNQYPSIQQSDAQRFAYQSSGFDNLDQDGLVLPAGYEPIDRTKNNDQEVQSTNKDIKQMLQKEVLHQHVGDTHGDCDLRADNSVTHTIVVPPPNVSNVQPVEDVDDNDVAVYFGAEKDGSSEKNNKTLEPVTEISVATSISENVEQYETSHEFGQKIKKQS